VRTRDAKALRVAIKPSLARCTKHWHSRATTTDGDGVHTLEYVVTLKRKTDPDELLAIVRAAAGQALIDVELE
jgi:hypothetical protein